MVVASNLNFRGDRAYPLSPSTNPPSSDTATAGSRIQKLTKVAQDFEGVLLSTWLQEVQKNSLDPSGSDLDSGSGTLQSLGTQAVAQAIAQRGGLGIARMIVDHYRHAVDGRSEITPSKEGQGRVGR